MISVGLPLTVLPPQVDTVVNCEGCVPLKVKLLYRLDVGDGDPVSEPAAAEALETPDDTTAVKGVLEDTELTSDDCVTRADVGVLVLKTAAPEGVL